MQLLIEKLKISNFLSFFGEYEVYFRPFTAIMCNFYEGKDDLFRAFEFVLGARIADLRVENALELVHKVLREEFLINRATDTYVEITVCLLQEKKQIKFCRSVKNGVNNLRIEHKISDLVTSSLLYEEKLSSLGINISQKNLIFYKSYFNNVIWGSAEDLEMTISTCLRENYLLEDWKKANKKLEHLKQLKNQTAEKHYTSMKKSHYVLEEYSKKYSNFFANRETAIKKILQGATDDSSNGNTSPLTDYSEEISFEDIEKKRQDIASLENNIIILTEMLNNLKLKEAFLISLLHHEEIKLAARLVNASLLQNRVRYLKTAIQKKENQMSGIWEKMQEIKYELESLSQKITFALISLQEKQIINYRQNRFTQYGRFYDYLQPSRHVHLLKQIIGIDIFYAHLCDSVEDAFTLLRQIKDLKFEQRETFLPFENYSHKLKDIITASGERGIQINTLEELLIFLCKLKHYQLINEVPVIVQRDFDFENIVSGDYFIYIHHNIHFTSDGVISYNTGENDFSLESEKELLENLMKLNINEEMNYRKYEDLLFMKWEILVDMYSLENDVFYLKQKCKKSTHEPPRGRKPSPEMEIYEEYYDIFKESAKEREKYESELQQERELFYEERDSSASPNEESVSVIEKNLEEVLEEKRKTQTQLEDFTQKLRRLELNIVCTYNFRKHFIKFENNLDKSKFYFEKEYKQLKKLMREDDLEDFLGSKEWRKIFISALVKDFCEIKKKLKLSSEEFLNIATARKRKLYQLFEHCSRRLSSTFSHIMNDALPFIQINFDSEEEKIQIMSCLGEDKINVDIKHFNTLLKFISAFSLFLEITNFDNIPLMIVDDIEEYFPNYNDRLEAVLEFSNLEKILPDNENPRFHLLMRLGQFLKHFIKKNIPHKLIRKNGSSTDYTNGPVQLIYFAKEDLVHAAEHCIWIQNKILPEKYLSENCNSYSEIHEINLEGLFN